MRENKYLGILGTAAIYAAVWMSVIMLQIRVEHLIANAGLWWYRVFF